MYGQRIPKSRILSGIDGYTESWVSGHNEVTRKLEDGTIIVRFHKTDIVTISADRKTVEINNGGYSKRATTRHINGILERYNIRVKYHSYTRIGRSMITNNQDTYYFDHKILLDCEPNKQDIRVVGVKSDLYRQPLPVTETLIA